MKDNLKNVLQEASISIAACLDEPTSVKSKDLEHIQNLISKIESFISLTESILTGDIVKRNDTEPKYTYIYGDECSDVWNSLGFTIHDDDDRIKLQFVKYEERGSYDED